MCELKAVLIGDSAVGKTSLFMRMKGQDFVDDQTSTVGGSCSIFQVKTEKGEVDISIWDTAGQERFRTIVPMYFRKAAVVIIVFDITCRQSFENIDEWVKIVNENSTNIQLIIIGNKCDLRSENPDFVSTSEIIDAGNKYGALLAGETSALSGSGIDLLKETIANCYFTIANNEKADDQAVEITENTNNGNWKDMCC